MEATTIEKVKTEKITLKLGSDIAGVIREIREVKGIPHSRIVDRAVRELLDKDLPEYRLVPA